MVGKIVEFDEETQTAIVQLHMNDFIKTREREYDKVETTPLLRIPVHFPQSQAFAITFPIQPEDDCIVIFTHRGIRHWLEEDREEYTAEEGIPEEACLHVFDRNDAVVLVGFNSIPNAIQNFDPEDMVLRNKNQEEHVQELRFNLDGSIQISNTRDFNITVNDTQKFCMKEDGSIGLEASGDITIIAGGALNLAGATVNINE